MAAYITIALIKHMTVFRYTKEHRVIAIPSPSIATEVEWCTKLRHFAIGHIIIAKASSELKGNRVPGFLDFKIFTQVKVVNLVAVLAYRDTSRRRSQIPQQMCLSTHLQVYPLNHIEIPLQDRC